MHQVIKRICAAATTVAFALPIALAIALGFALGGPAAAQDDPRLKPVFNARYTLSQSLHAARESGKPLVLVIRNGVSYVGKIKDVGTESVVVTELRGKEYFDAWVRLDAIVAMEERVRSR